MNKSNENHYPSDGTDIVADDRLIPPEVKLAYLVVMMDGSGLKSAKREKLHSA